MDKFNNAFIVYQGSHGSESLSHVDVVLPGAAYTEKDAIILQYRRSPTNDSSCY